MRVGRGAGRRRAAHREWPLAAGHQQQPAGGALECCCPLLALGPGGRAGRRFTPHPQSCPPHPCSGTRWVVEGGWGQMCRLGRVLVRLSEHTRQRRPPTVASPPAAAAAVKVGSGGESSVGESSVGSASESSGSGSSGGESSGNSSSGSHVHLAQALQLLGLGVPVAAAVGLQEGGHLGRGRGEEGRGICWEAGGLG